MTTPSWLPVDASNSSIIDGRISGLNTTGLAGVLATGPAAISSSTFDQSPDAQLTAVRNFSDITKLPNATGGQLETMAPGLSGAAGSSMAIAPSDQPADDAMNTKLIASLVLFLITMIAGYLPIRVIPKQKYIEHAMFAGGGVLMATAFCHIIPEAHDGYRETLRAASGPLHSHSHSHDHHNHQQGHEHSGVSSNDESALKHDNDTNLHDQPGAPSDATGALDHEGHPLAESGGFWDELGVPYVEIALCIGFLTMYLVEMLMVRLVNNFTHEHPCDANSARVSENGQLINFGLAGGESARLADGPSSVAGSASVGNLSATAIIPTARRTSANSYDLNGPSANAGPSASNLFKFFRGLPIIAAFGAHLVFDGVAIGSQETVEKVWTIFFAISCHKLIIVAVVGLELFANTLGSHLWTLFHLAIFSILSPIGIILVVIAQGSLNLSSNDRSMILLQSFATGTLLYIIFFEILQPKEESHNDRKFGKFFSLIGGFLFMLTMLTLVG